VATTWEESCQRGAEPNTESRAPSEVMPEERVIRAPKTENFEALKKMPGEGVG